MGRGAVDVAALKHSLLSRLHLFQAPWLCCRAEQSSVHAPSWAEADCQHSRSVIGLVWMLNADEEGKQSSVGSGKWKPEGSSES